ncbi:hypothetical protein HN51_048475 [Arachis hypogaea]|uniref:Protein kinase domain-containing protein n=1 Tax=Arachis hypogaea TaxID=3818 RepID=A0A445AL88_ARAHY|nr:probable inactive receptor kinase At5g67200 [Arachis ipaensis]XP_025633981.1 probable inactive receptor kinase At5g67200 [Arachis hypogaea]QHO25015.1 putative inactive receptor kinase [Arachis hypogaea]RYR27193.1 hypothetical protein Ahy_B02g061532 isoform E [Arachis hypogaea]
MAASLVGGAAIGAVFGELLKAVIDMKDRAVMFKPTLAYLRTTLTAIDPVIKEIEQQNNELGRANAELELLIKEMEEGTKLVYKCSKIHKLNFPARIRYQEQLVALVESLVRFFIIDMQAQNARDLKETLMKVRRIHSAVNKMQSNSNEETTAGGGSVSESDSANVPVELNQIDVNDETTVTIQQQNDENVTEITNSVSEITVQLETLRNDSVEQVMEDGTRLLHIASQTKEEANNSQEEKQLTVVKSYDQSYTDQKRFMGICLPTTPIRRKKSGGKFTFVEGCPYKFDIEDLLRGSAEVLGHTSYATTYTTEMKNGVTLVIKRLKDVVVDKQEFEQKIKIVQRISQHPNVLSPLACYCSNDENLLIYEYMPTGSFSKLLHETSEDRDVPLDWNSRMKISLGVAKGLAHIHSLEGGTYVHGNVRSSNVLVTNDHQGCISDLSMAYSLSNSFDQFRKTGYQQNEGWWLEAMKEELTPQKCDVYSFGVLLFEMLTGRVPSEYNDLPTHVKDLAIDGFPVYDSAISQIYKKYARKMRELAEKCTFQRKEIPSMASVVREMEEIRALY